MTIIELESHAHGYAWNQQTVTFETCELGTFQDKLFMICADGTVWEVVKVMEVEQTDHFRSAENDHVLKQIMLGDRSYTYAEVFRNLARESKFSLGNSLEFPGFTYGRTWNGFASPYYTKEVFEEICNYFSVVYKFVIVVINDNNTSVRVLCINNSVFYDFIFIKKFISYSFNTENIFDIF